MSKIEKALEKAVEAMGSQPVRPKEARADAQGETHTFTSVPALITPADVDPHLVCITEPYSATAEQYKQLRARIMKDMAKDFRNLLMTVSANEGEGKSITALNLAISLAQELDHTVLLVDTDLRMPTIHKYLGLIPRYGLSDYLKGDVELPDILIKTGIGKLVLLPAGMPPDNPAELLSSERMKNLVQEMKHRYADRYIIFDTPPLLLTADAISLSRHMDGVLVVVQADQTHQKDVAKALSLIKGVPILGVVLNDVPGYLARREGYHYYSNYRYGGPSKRQGQ